MEIEKQKWNLPSKKDDNAYMVRANKAEQHLREALDIIYAIHESIPHKPASEVKSIIKHFLDRFR